MDIISGDSLNPQDNTRRLRFFGSSVTRFAVVYFAEIVVLLVLMNTIFLVVSRDMIFSSKQGLVQSQAAVITRSLEEGFAVLTTENVARVMDVLDVADVTQVIITDAVGTILYGSAEDVTQTSFTNEFTMRSAEGIDIFYAEFSGGSFSSSALTPVVSGGTTIGVVYVHEEDRDQGVILLEMQGTLGTISVAAVVFSMAMFFFVVWSSMRRLNGIFKAIKTVREGEYNYHINVSGNDEFALLGDEFNRLTERLRETDEIRRKFVANASHELKTPLASIRLLSDSILQNENIERHTMQEFIGDIGAEAGRLSRTTEKLLTLTRLDSKIPQEERPVNIKHSILSAIRLLRPLAAGKELTINQELEDGCVILASQDAMHQIVFNLIENAIKYNKQGGNVSVRLETVGGEVVMTVDDTGVGVPEADLPQIFDRFYRVDKARSREAGGSGLGLAIVKDTIRELSGSITALPREGGGMSFIARFTHLRQ